MKYLKIKVALWSSHSNFQQITCFKCFQKSKNWQKKCTKLPIIPFEKGVTPEFKIFCRGPPKDHPHKI